MKEEEEAFRKLMVVALISGVGGFLLGIAKGIINEHHGSPLLFLRGMLASVVVAIIAAFALSDIGMSFSRQAAIIGILSYIADDMLSGIVILGRLFRNDPIGFVRDVYRSIRGGKKE